MSDVQGKVIDEESALRRLLAESRSAKAVLIYKAAKVLIESWDEWDAEGRQLAQQTQYPEAWDDVMYEKVLVTLRGLVEDCCRE